MHCSKFLVVQFTLFLPTTLISQFLQPGMIEGQFLNEVLLSQRPGCMLDSLKGTLLVSATMTLLGSRSPIDPRKILCTLSSSGMKTWFWRSWRQGNQNLRKGWQSRRIQKKQKKQAYHWDIVDGCQQSKNRRVVRIQCVGVWLRRHSVDCAGFEFSIEDVWRETLAFKTDERRRQRRKRSNQYVRIGFEWQFKPVLSQNWGTYVNPKFWRVKKLPVGLLRRRRGSRMSGSTKLEA